MKNILLNIPVKRIVKISALVAGVVLLCLLSALAFLPELVSSRAVQQQMRQAISVAMKRQVSWAKFALTWTDGLDVSGLKLGDGPAPLLNTSIERLVVAPSLGRGADGRFGVDLVVKIRNVRAELAPGPAKPVPPPLKDPLTLLAEAIQKVQNLDYPLPCDVRVLVEVAPLQVGYSLPGKGASAGRQLRLQDFSLRFAMPSLATAPLTAEVNGSVALDGRAMGKVGVTAKVSDLVTKEQPKERRIHLASALFAVAATAPGANVTLSGGLNRADGFAASCKLDLPALLAVVQPLLPPAVPKMTGAVELLLRARSDARRDLSAALTLDGVGLTMQGGALKAKRVGPLAVQLRQHIAADHARQIVDFPGGTLAVPGLLDAAWTATVNQPSLPERSLELRAGPIQLDLAKALALVAPFLPPNSPVKELGGVAFLRSLKLQLKGPGNHGKLALSGAGVKIPRLRLALGKEELTAGDIDLLLDKADCPLVAALPTRLSAQLLFSADNVALSGATPLMLRGMRGTTGVTLADLNLKSASPRKIAATAELTQTFDLDHAALGKLLTVDKIHQQLRLQARADNSGDLDATVPELTATIAAIQATLAGKRLASLPLSAALTADGLHLAAAKGSKPTLRQLAAKLSAGDFLQLTAETALSGAAPQYVASHGAARLDLRRVMPFAAAFAPSGLKADGVVSANWDLAAALPDKAPLLDKQPLRAAKAGLALFDRLGLTVKLDNISATVPMAKGALRLTGVRSGPDLQLVSGEHGDIVKMAGGVQFASLSGFPGAAAKLASPHGSFTFNGALSGWREFRLTEELHIEPPALAHEAELNISRIDALLEEKLPFNTATLLKRLDATLFASVDGAFSRELQQLLPGIEVAGTAGGGVRVDLVAGRELALRSFLKTKEFGVRLADGTRVEGMRSDIALNRVYSLAAAAPERWTPLSAALVRPVVVKATNSGAVDVAARINDDLRGEAGGSRSFSIKSVTARVAGVPLVVTALEGDLIMTPEKTGIGFLQADLLGGTVLARALLDLRPDVPAIDAAGSFSNLDVIYLLPPEARAKQGARNAEITGEMSFTAPLTPEQRLLFEQLRLTLNVRKIGADTIERALFSLDPYERNEQVVAQRKMLRLGALKGIRASAVDGAFSMEGEASIKGVSVDLPKVERLRISELPLRQELSKNRAGIMAIRGLLDLARADTLTIGPKGELQLKRRNYEQ
jgi:hypothetical protein